MTINMPQKNIQKNDQKNDQENHQHNFWNSDVVKIAVGAFIGGVAAILFAGSIVFNL